MGRLQAISTITISVLLVATAVMLSGCPMGTYGSVIKPEQKAAIVKGKTTKVELLRELGNPDQTVDLGGGKEEMSYIREAITSYGIRATSENTEFWILINKEVVEDFGERPTTKSPKYIK